MKLLKFIKITHLTVSLALALFFLNAGIKKFIPKPKRNILEETIKDFNSRSFNKPHTFKITMKMFKESGFFYFVGAFQILSSILIIFKPTKLLGLLCLLPITINIFILHLLMDNRISENIETGLILIVNALLIFFYINKFRPLIIK
jgi:hypothetical protein